MFQLFQQVANKYYYPGITEEKKNEEGDLFKEILEKKDIHLNDKEVAHVLVSDNEVLSMKDVPGLKVKVKNFYKAVKLNICVADNSKISKPIHMCVGKLSTSKEPLQQIFVDFDVGENCDVTVIAHCLFQSNKVRHQMEGNIHVKKNSSFKYIEGHIHPEKGDVVVKPIVKINLEENSKFLGDFQLLEGICGKLSINYDVQAGANSVTDLTVRVSAKGDDVVRISEDCFLNGKNGKGILKSRVSARDNADCEIKNVLIAKEAHCKGHVDCHEILKDNGTVTAIPTIKATHHLATVTHEASLGRVNEKQLETLLSKGLTEDEATELIIKGMLEM